MKGLYLLFLFCLSFVFHSKSQDTIRLDNFSFEDFPRHSYTPRGWYDCGFPDESPPDIHPQMDGGEFKVNAEPADGRTYIGMVVRDNVTWEAIGQRLNTPLKENQCYDFSLMLARSMFYKSLSRVTNQEANYDAPVVIRIWGGNEYCGCKELLGKTANIINNYWEEYSISFMPSQSFEYVLIEAYYTTSAFDAYNGNVLIDAASEIISRACTKNDTIAQQINREIKSERIYHPSQRKESRVRSNPNLNIKVSLTIRIEPEQTTESVTTKLRKELDKQNVVDDSILLISVLVSSTEDRQIAKKKLKEAMKSLKGSYKTYMSQVIVSK